MSKRKQSRVHPRYKSNYRLWNWAEYDQALVRRGDLTVWFHEEAIGAWKAGLTGARGRPRRYLSLAIDTAISLRLAYGLP